MNAQILTYPTFKLISIFFKISPKIKTFKNEKENVFRFKVGWDSAGI